MKFRVLRDFRGSQDGMTVSEFRAGDEVEISDHLAPHVAQWAEPIVEKTAAAAGVVAAPRRNKKPDE